MIFVRYGNNNHFSEKIFFLWIITILERPKYININIHVTMIHGKKDEVVPISYSKKVLKVFKNANKKLVIIKDGDHSLSSKRNLDKITKELNNIISNYI